MINQQDKNSGQKVDNCISKLMDLVIMDINIKVLLLGKYICNLLCLKRNLYRTKVSN